MEERGGFEAPEFGAEGRPATPVAITAAESSGAEARSRLGN
jgi:hypothetical protein